MPPVVCRFWQQGNCRNGNNCKFLHSSNPNQPISNGNRFAPLQDNSSPRNNGYQNRAPPPGTLPYALDKSAILVDLTSERPQWILSAYGPGRNAPAQLFGGPVREQSFEEMRLLHYLAVASGNPQQAVQDAEKLYQTSEQQIQTAVNDVDGAISFVFSSEKDHPNRIDIVRDSQAGGGSQPNPFNPQLAFQQAGKSAPNPFGAANQPPPATSAFGAPYAPAFGAPPAPAFGSPSTSRGGFGQPSPLGQKPSPFGAPAFGAPTQLGSGGAFGQPSTLGQKPNPFGVPTASTSTSTAPSFSTFTGTPNPFAQKPANTTPFGAPSRPATSNPFGAPTQPNPSPFRASPPAQSNSFGQPSNPDPNPNPFGAPSSQPNLLGGTPAPFGVPSPAKNPFGAPSQPPRGAPSPFGQPLSAPQPNPFEAASAPAATNPFGQSPPNPTLATNPFEQPLAPGPPSSNPFGAPQPQPGVNGYSDVQLGAQHPEIGSYITKDASGRLVTFKGNRVIYKGNDPGFTGQDGSWQRIWFPDGPPILTQDTGVDDALYDEKIEAAYKYAKQNGSFQGGMMPLLPPKREWCHWDF